MSPLRLAVEPHGPQHRLARRVGKRWAVSTSHRCEIRLSWRCMRAPRKPQCWRARDVVTLVAITTGRAAAVQAGGYVHDTHRSDCERAGHRHFGLGPDARRPQDAGKNPEKHPTLRHGHSPKPAKPAQA